MSGPKTTTTQNSTSKQNAKSRSVSQLQPYGPSQDAVSQIPDYATTAYGQAQPYLDPGMSSLNDFQQGLFSGGGFGQGAENLGNATDSLMQGQSYINQAPDLFDKAGGLYGDTFNTVKGYLDPIASGSMIGADNPYVNGLLATLQNKVANDVGGQFAKAGRSFSGYHARALGEGETNAMAPVLFNNYQFERNAQANALQAMRDAGFGAAQGFGNLGSGYAGLSNNEAQLANQFSTIPGYYDAIAANKNQAGLQGAGIQTLMQTLPYTSAANYSNLLMPSAQAFGKNKQKSKSKGTTINVGTGTSSVNDGGASTAGMIIGGLGLLSDRRAKEDIEPIGKLNDGQIVYRFKYKGDDVTQIGLMADEVEKVRPEAVYTGRNGLKLVDYKLATDGAAL